MFLNLLFTPTIISLHFPHYSIPLSIRLLFSSLHLFIAPILQFSISFTKEILSQNNILLHIHHFFILNTIFYRMVFHISLNLLNCEAFQLRFYCHGCVTLWVIHLIILLVIYNLTELDSPDWQWEVVAILAFLCLIISHYNNCNLFCAIIKYSLLSP